MMKIKELYSEFLLIRLFRECLKRKIGFFIEREFGSKEITIGIANIESDVAHLGEWRGNYSVTLSSITEVRSVYKKLRRAIKSLK